MSLSKILAVHNRYQHAGGEDAVVRAEGELLRQMGHEFSLFEVSHDSIRGVAPDTATDSFYEEKGFR